VIVPWVDSTPSEARNETLFTLGGVEHENHFWIVNGSEQETFGSQWIGPAADEDWISSGSPSGSIATPAAVMLIGPKA
jgi:hypothetical protein